MTRTVEQARDPRVDPQAADKVRCLWASPQAHHGPAAIMTVEARIGDLIATSSTGDGEIRWQKLDTWCGLNAWVKGWEVLHVADPL